MASSEVERQKARFVQHEIMWADVTTNLTSRYLHLEYELYGRKPGLWNWVTKEIDPLALQIMYYIKDKGDKASGEMSILGKVDRGFHVAAEKSKDVVVIAHSLGSVIAFDYLFKFRKFFLPPELNVRAFITLGSPIPLFISAMGHVESELTLPPNIKAWYNILDHNDGIARRCKPFFKNIPVKDVKVRTGLLPLEAHCKYWQSRATATEIAKIIQG